MSSPLMQNRQQEFLTRPTAPADFWPLPNSHVLGGRDLQRSEQGTWLGLTKQGRLACLTNFRESSAQVYGTKSRGGLPKAYLTLPPDSTQTPQEFARHMVEDVGVSDVGGFSLVFGRLRKKDVCAEGGRGLAIISNRTEDVSATTWICGEPGETQGLSNSHFGDRTWPKVVEGEEHLRKLVEDSVAANLSKDDLIKALLNILSLDTLPRRKHGEDWETYVFQLRNSIFIPRIGGEELDDSPADEIAAADQGLAAKTDSGVYGTQKQTIILVDHDGHASYVEKTLYDERARPTPNNVRQYDFEIKGWND